MGLDIDPFEEGIADILVTYHWQSTLWIIKVAHTG